MLLILRFKIELSTEVHTLGTMKVVLCNIHRGSVDTIFCDNRSHILSMLSAEYFSSLSLLVETVKGIKHF